MNIGEVSKQSGVNAKAIRYYESIGLLPEPIRTASGYRQYDQESVERLRLLGRARSLGFSIEDCRKLMDLWGDRSSESEGVRSVIMTHIADIDRKIFELSTMRHSLIELAENAEIPGPEEVFLKSLEYKSAEEE